MEEIEALRYVIFFKRKGEKESNYMLALGNTSKRKIPKKIIFIGNYDIFKAPNDEEKVDFNDNYLYYEWKFFDIYVHDKVKKNLFSKVL